MVEGLDSSALGFSRVASAIRRGDVVFALALMAIMVVLILPMPKWFLDVSLALSLTFSVLVLMTALFIERPLDFSSFPTVLLVSTMLRLALNVASTRLILTDGHEGPNAAGAVIQAFGNFVMGGNYVIGFIVFAILVIVNFVVITKGSGRIAEVSARFSLDAMPGKQMAIDADLSAGLINEEVARHRRKQLEEESNFFGAMDGAAKFVRGDAIAGLCITFINAVGGMIIGVAQNGLGLGEAAQSYTLLTVGDGLITQIPALIVSTAAGMLVSKAGIEGSADKALFKQLSAYPTALGLSSFLMAALSLLPGMPMLPFLFLALTTGTAAWKLTEKKDREKQEKILNETQPKDSLPQEDSLAAAMQLDQVRLELGYSLLPLVNGEQGEKLTDQIKSLRLQLAREIGFVLPTVRIQDNLELPSTIYVIRIKEIEVGRGDLRPNMLLVMDPDGRDIPLGGEPTIEPTFGLRAMWIPHNLRAEAESKGYTVVEPMTVVSTHLSELIRDNTADLLSFSEMQKLLDDLDKPHQKLLGDLIPSHLTTAGLQRILQNLLAERVSIRDLPTILEGIAEACASTKSLTQITEHVRSRLSRQLCMQYTNREGVLPLVILSPEWERTLNDSLVGESESRQLALPPSKLQEFTGRIRDIFEEQSALGEVPVLLVNSGVRSYLRSIIERFRPQTPVFSQSEIHPKARIKTVGKI